MSRARDAGNAPPGNRGAVGYPSNSRPALSGPLGPRNRRRRVRTHPLSLQTVVRTRIPKKIPKRKAPPPGTRAALGPLRTTGCRREAGRTEGSRRFVSDARDVLARGTVSTFPTAVPRLNEPELLPGKIRVYLAFFHGHAVTSGVLETQILPTRVPGQPVSETKPRLTVCEPRNCPKLALQLLLFSPDPRGAASRHSRSAPAVWKCAPIAVALAVCATYF